MWLYTFALAYNHLISWILYPGFLNARGYGTNWGLWRGVCLGRVVDDASDDDDFMLELILDVVDNY